MPGKPFSKAELIQVATKKIAKSRSSRIPVKGKITPYNIPKGKVKAK